MKAPRERVLVGRNEFLNVYRRHACNDLSESLGQSSVFARACAEKSNGNVRLSSRSVWQCASNRSRSSARTSQPSSQGKTGAGERGPLHQPSTQINEAPQSISDSRDACTGGEGRRRAQTRKTFVARELFTCARKPLPEARTSMQSSVLHTADVPSFDQKTGQLALASHHLISAPASIVAACSAGGTLLFDPPPAQPYQQRTAVDDDANPEQRKRKRRRTTRALPPDEHSSPADWIRHREREQDRTTTDRESDAHHAGIAPELQNAIEAVQSGHAATEQEGDDDDERWTGVKRGYEWRRSDDADARTELDLVGLASGAAAAALAPEGRLALSDDEASVDAASLIGRVVTNERKSEAKLHLTTAAADPLASLCIPPSSGFLLSDMATWSNPASGIADLGRTKGGWDVLLIESVPFPATAVYLLPGLCADRQPAFAQSALAQRVGHEVGELRNFRSLRPLEARRTRLVGRQASSRCCVAHKPRQGACKRRERGTTHLCSAHSNHICTSSSGDWSRINYSLPGVSGTSPSGTGSRSLRKRENRSGPCLRSIAAAMKVRLRLFAVWTEANYSS